MDSAKKIPLAPESSFISEMNFQVNPLIILTIQMRLFLFNFLEKQNGRSSFVPDRPLRRKTDEERSRFIHCYCNLFAKHLFNLTKKTKKIFSINFKRLYQDKVHRTIPPTPTNKIKPIRKFKIFNHEMEKHP